MGKVEEIERLVAKFKVLTRNYHELMDMVHENAVERSAVIRELDAYLTQRDIAMLLGVCTSNVGRLIKGPKERST